jgi:heat shock protein beta
LNDEKLKQLVHHYSEFITHPIFLLTTEKTQVPDDNEVLDLGKDADKEVDEFDQEDEIENSKPSKMKDVVTQSWSKVNAEGAIWTRPKEQISDDEYQSFYQTISRSGSNATTWSHFDAEGNINFKSLLYLPDEIPFELKQGNFEAIKNGIKLYVRRVLISDSFELLPRYMAMIKGVVDSDDLPLNVNRETLQESKIITIIRKKVVRKVLDMIAKFAEEDAATENIKDVEIDAEGNVIDSEMKATKDVESSPYIKWYEKFGPSLKMGVIDDSANQKRIAKLLRFNTNKQKYTSLDDYVGRMKDWQKQIYFIAGQKQSDLETSPFLEKFVEKDVEVLFLTDPADEYVRITKVSVFCTLVMNHQIC